MARSHLSVTLAYSTDNVAFTDFAGVTAVTPPEANMKEIEATHLGSTGSIDEWLPGFINSGQLDVEINYLYSLVNTIDDFFYGRTTLYLRITIPDDNGSNDSTIVATGFINKWRPHDQLTPGKTTSMRATFGFKCTGKVTYTPAT